LSRRIRMPTGLIQMLCKRLEIQLLFIKNRVVSGEWSKARARMEAKSLFDNHMRRIVQVTREHLWTRLKVGEFPRDEFKKLREWRDEAIKDFNAVLADIR